MKLAECIIAWDEETGEVEVGPLIRSGVRDWSKPYPCTDGGVSFEVQEMSPVEARHFVLSTFVALVVRDKIDPQKAHRAFLNIDEYCQAIPIDVDGAMKGDDE